MSGLKVALWGFGHMNKVILTYLQEKGYKVVAVFGHHDVGKDAGETAGAAHLGVPLLMALRLTPYWQLPSLSSLFSRLGLS